MQGAVQLREPQRRGGQPEAQGPRRWQACELLQERAAGQGQHGCGAVVRLRGRDGEQQHAHEAHGRGHVPEGGRSAHDHEGGHVHGREQHDHGVVLPVHDRWPEQGGAVQVLLLAAVAVWLQLVGLRNVDGVHE